MVEKPHERLELFITEVAVLDSGASDRIVKTPIQDLSRVQ